MIYIFSMLNLCLMIIKVIANSVNNSSTPPQSSSKVMLKTNNLILQVYNVQTVMFNAYGSSFTVASCVQSHISHSYVC